MQGILWPNGQTVAHRVSGGNLSPPLRLTPSAFQSGFRNAATNAASALIKAAMAVITPTLNKVERPSVGAGVV